MNLKQFLLLLLISAIWGGSFIFMKELSPIFGPVLTSSLRLLSASLFLYIIYYFQKYKINWRENFKIFFFLGLGNSAIPFTLYAYAALYISPSISVILNSTAPMFGAIFAFFIVKENLSYKKMIGLLLGTVGVGVVTSITFAEGTIELYLSIFGCITAAALYGLSGVYAKKYASHIEAKELTLGSITISGLVLLPFTIFSPITGTVTLPLIGMVIVFGIVCTAVAYLIYYYLLKEIGTVKALTVTYLMPVFGIFWSYLFYSEIITLNTLFGLILISIGIALVTNKKKYDMKTNVN
jgi:drug/metabolite transporter (DMT)-like permease